MYKKNHSILPTKCQWYLLITWNSDKQWKQTLLLPRQWPIKLHIFLLATFLAHIGRHLLLSLISRVNLMFVSTPLTVSRICHKSFFSPLTYWSSFARDTHFFSNLWYSFFGLPFCGSPQFHPCSAELLVPSSKIEVTS